MSLLLRVQATLLLGLLPLGCFSDVEGDTGSGSAGSSGTSADASSGVTSNATTEGTTSTAGVTTSPSTDDSGPSSSSSTSSDTGPPPIGCAETEDCADDSLPTGWDGPFFVFAFSPEREVPQCPNQWAEVGGAPTSAQPQTDPYECTCSCSGDLPFACGFVVSAYPAADCAGAPTAVNTGPGCAMLPGTTQSASAVGVPGFTNTCDPGEAAPTDPPPPPFMAGLRVCEPRPSDNTCEDGICLTVPTGAGSGQLCIAEGGQRSCQNLGKFTERHVGFTGATDSRTCDGGCDCSPTAACTAQLTLTAESDCNGIGTSGSLGQCVDGPGMGAAITSSAGMAPCEAAAKTYMSSGEVDPKGPATTYCCVAAQ